MPGNRKAAVRRQAGRRIQAAGLDVRDVAADPLCCCGHDVDERLGRNLAFEGLNCEQAGCKRLGQRRRVKRSLCLFDEQRKKVGVELSGCVVTADAPADEVP